MIETASERLIPLMEAARRMRVGREVALRRCLKQGTAVQRDERWYVRVPAGVEMLTREGA